MNSRRYTTLDRALIHLDQALRTVFGQPLTSGRERPEGAPAELTPAERQRAVRLMRVNHTGEVCAQALYQGQALTARRDAVRESLEQAAAEEGDHLAWCEARVRELGGHTSVLNPLFYAGSLTLGALAGRAGDRWNLGFLAETERQVVRHLEDHLQRLPAGDHPSRAILEQMKEDEGHHAVTASQAGGAELPAPLRLVMKATSKVMTGTSYWI